MPALSDLRRDAAAQIEAWAASGAMALTRTTSGDLVGPPAGLVPKLARVASTIEARARDLGGALVVDPLPLLGERAAVAGLPPGGATSCGGASRLLAGDAGWLALTLARPEDLDLVPAWLGLDGPPDDPWAEATTALAAQPMDGLVAQARLLGLPHGVVPAPRPGDPADAPLPAGWMPVAGPAPAGPRLAELTVADLTSLWAGPLCGSLLADAGATVIKVESTDRPDGARRGPIPFFELMNGTKRSAAVDLRSPGGVAELRTLLAEADVVLEGSRPRALEQLGIDAAEVVATGRTRVWVSITAHGRAAPGRERVGFGDDTAAEGGLVAWAEGRPWFLADAVADPTTGLVAAAATLEAVARGGRGVLDVALSRVAAFLAGPTLPLDGWTGTPTPPRARPTR